MDISGLEKVLWAAVQDVPGVRKLDDVKEEPAAEAMARALEARQSRGDALMNLAVTSMVAQAYCTPETTSIACGSRGT